MIIRPETTDDISRINEIVQSAFKTHAYSNQLDANGCVLPGEPEHYNRFAFRQSADLTLADVPTEYCLALAFINHTTPSGEVKYNPIFDLYG